ncbi:hypothetical protein F5B22DRAFT_627745, partial [Xylaria bambusicola]|uniref:uncharacterized protein n=1 Tax=Xylaria bambusicola TaxID=326684 RepID=UPI002008AAD8
MEHDLAEQTQPKAPRKYNRSTSPRAVERRRLQNRISQRNRRMRIQNAANRETCIVEPIAHQPYQEDEPTVSFEEGNPPLTTSHGGNFQEPRVLNVADNTVPFCAPSIESAEPSSGAMIPLMAEDLVLQQLPAWSPVDSMIGMPMPTLSGEGHLSHFETDSPANNCTCNETTGPCPGHIEKMRTQVLRETSSSLRSNQHHRTKNMPGGEISMHQEASQPPLDRTGFSLSHELHQQQPFHCHNSTESSSTSSSHAHTRLSTQSPSSVPPFGASSSIVGYSSHGASVADMTRRFVAIIDLVQSLGFSHFDEMAAAYYTAAFEKESLPAMAQSASRSRRLKPMLMKLQDNSVQWQRWESRGLREGISEAANRTYVAEIEAQGRVIEPSQFRNESANLIVAIERLLRDHGWGRRDGAPRSHDWEGMTLSEQLDAAPDSMPCLWTLLTELAGAEGLYCDRTARAALAVLLSAP